MIMMVILNYKINPLFSVMLFKQRMEPQSLSEKYLFERVKIKFRKRDDL